jgi:hypothetical protein
MLHKNSRERYDKLKKVFRRLMIGAGADISVDYSGFKESALAFVIRTFRHFHYMYEMARVPPSQRQIPTLADLVGV